MSDPFLVLNHIFGTFIPTLAISFTLMILLIGLLTRWARNL